MKPFDSRLLKYARDTKGYILFLVFLGVVSAALIAAQIFLIANIVAPVFYGEATLQTSARLIIVLAVVFAARVGLTYVQEAMGHRSALRVISDLRTKVLRHAGDLGDRWLSQGHTSQVVTLATRGLDDLEDYFVKFLPQLFLCVTVLPAMVILVLGLDWISALIIALCIPLVPLFMILIGRLTAKYSNERLESMQRLSSQLLDLLAGLSTLKALGREKGPEKQVDKLGKTFAQKTMQTLYVAFLSGAALEFLTTLSTALVAVSVGLRMVDGSILLTEGLILIMLTPEVFKPLREVGTQFHASSDGVAAANAAFEILDVPLPQRTNSTPAPNMRTSDIVFDDLSVNAPGRTTVAPAHLSATIPPGTIAVLRGPSGSGKTTAVNVLLGLLKPDMGTVRVGGIDVGDLDLDSWWGSITWVSQRPVLVPGTVAENLGITDPDAPDVVAAARQTGFDRVLDSLPNGWNTKIGQGGVGLSVGQRQRLALTRALVSANDVVILDEPSAHLDAVSEEYVGSAVRLLKDRGHTVVVIAHRAAIAHLADVVIDVESAERDLSSELALEREEREAREAIEHVLAGDTDYAIPTSWGMGSAKESSDE